VCSSDLLEVLTRATMTRDAAPSGAMSTQSGHRRSSLGPALAALAVLAVLGTIVLSTVAVARRGKARTQAAMATTTSMTASSTTSPITTDVPPETISPAPPIGTASPSATGGSSKGKHGAGKKTKTPGVASASTRPDCALPYTTDEEGHRHYKAECLK
jgi:hypothetical protein